VVLWWVRSDIAVGRPSFQKITEEARAVIDKIISYDKDPATLGDWHLRALYIADDEDGNAHLTQAEKLAIENGEIEDWFNISKVYFDAYQQVATSCRPAIPRMQKSAINSEMFKGMPRSPIT